MSGLGTAADILRLAGSAVTLGTVIADAATKRADPAVRRAREARREARRQRVAARRVMNARARAVRLRSLAEGMKSHSRIRRSRLARAARAEVIAKTLVRDLRDKSS